MASAPRGVGREPTPARHQTPRGLRFKQTASRGGASKSSKGEGAPSSATPTPPGNWRPTHHVWLETHSIVWLCGGAGVRAKQDVAKKLSKIHCSFSQRRLLGRPRKAKQRRGSQRKVGLGVHTRVLTYALQDASLCCRVCSPRGPLPRVWSFFKDRADPPRCSVLLIGSRQGTNTGPCKTWKSAPFTSLCTPGVQPYHKTLSGGRAPKAVRGPERPAVASPPGPPPQRAVVDSQRRRGARHHGRRAPSPPIPSVPLQVEQAIALALFQHTATGQG